MAKRLKGSNAGSFMAGREPHNSHKGFEFGNVAELATLLAAEPKKVMIDGREVEMSGAERSFRLTIERALAGNRHDLAHLIRLMIKYPSISGTSRKKQVIFIRGALARC